MSTWGETLRRGVITDVSWLHEIVTAYTFGTLRKPPVRTPPRVRCGALDLVGRRPISGELKLDNVIQVPHWPVPEIV